MAATTFRMLQLLSLLQARRDWPGGLLAERLEVSARTVRRDVDRLRELGYRVRAIKGPDGGYRLEGGSELPPLLFDDDQAVAVAIALRTATTSGADIGDAADRALATVRQVMPARLRARVDLLAASVPAPAPPVDPRVLVAVSEAIRAGEVLRFGYPGDDSLRRAEPHHLVARGGRWYLVGWDVDRDDWRVYRADRIQPRSARGRRFAPRTLPGGDPHAFLDARFRGATAGAEWPCRGSVVVALPLAAVAPYLNDGGAEALGPDRTRVSAGSWSWDALAASFGRFGAALEAPEPVELAAAFDTLAARFSSAVG